MRYVTEQIKKYISEHLNEPVTLNDIAKAVGYYKFHTSRIFKEETGLSLFEYIRRERLTASAFALRIGSEKVLDVALDFMFDSHEGLQGLLQTVLELLRKSLPITLHRTAGISRIIISTAKKLKRRNLIWKTKLLLFSRRSWNAPHAS